jgi:hypothetical protein
MFICSTTQLGAGDEAQMQSGIRNGVALLQKEDIWLVAA